MKEEEKNEQMEVYRIEEYYVGQCGVRWQHM